MKKAQKLSKMSERTNFYVRKVSNYLAIITKWYTFAAIFKQNVSKSKDNMTHCELQQTKSAKRKKKKQEELYKTENEKDEWGVGM